MIRISALTFALFAAFAPGIGHAQTNIDQGKSASQIFASACVDCHKAPRGLARGKNSWALTEFLSGHYTTSRDQAAALAAYVIGRGHAIAAPETGQDTKLPAKRAKQKETASPGDIFQRLFNPTIRPEPRPTAAASRRKEPITPKPSPEAPGPAADTHAEPAAPAVQPAGSVTSEPTADSHAEPAAAVAQPAGSVTSEPTAGTDDEAVAGPRKEEVAAPMDTALPNSGETTPVPRDDVPD